MRQTLYISDGTVSVRDFCKEDIALKIQWINDPKNHQYLHYDLPLEYGKTLRWFENRDLSVRLDCTIEYNDVPVGLIGLLGIDHTNCKAEYYITIGEHSYKHKGIATKASWLLLEYAFETLKMNKVYLNVDSENIIACNLYEKLGFRCEGIFREENRRGKISF